MIIVEIIYNLAQLIALSVISGFAGNMRRCPWCYVVVQGVIFGSAAVIGMLRPMVLSPGLIFDGRSVLLSLCGLFFGPVAAVIAGVMALICRILQGGVGTVMGSLVIISSCLWGIIFYYQWTRRHVRLEVWRFWIFGILVHVTMLLMVVTLPRGIIWNVLQKIGWPVLLLYPLATILIGKILFEIAEHHTASEALRASESRYRNLVDLAVDGILLGSPEGVIIEANQCLCKMFDMDRLQLIGKHIKDLPFTEESIKRSPFRFDLLLQGQTVVSDRTFKRRDGREVLIEMHTKMMPEGFYQSIIRDVTDRRRFEEDLKEHQKNLEELVKARTVELGLLNRSLSLEKERLERVNEDLQHQRQTVMKMMGALELVNKDLLQTQQQLIQVEKMASLGRLVAGIAHEINNPMSYVTTNLAMLQRYTLTIHEMLELYRGLEDTARTLFPKEMHGALAIIDDFRHESGLDDLLSDLKKLILETESGVQRVSKIVSDLRTFARQEKEVMELADLGQSLDCALNIVSSELKYKVTLIKEYGLLPRVLCYPRQMEQVFVNLLVNAAHAIKGKGQIILRTSHQGSDVVIEIEDNGVGIPESDLARIFDPFFTTKEVGQGMGLGLSIVYNVIQNHHGDIKVKSAVGKGTTVVLKIPVNTDPESPT